MKKFLLLITVSLCIYSTGQELSKWRFGGGLGLGFGGNGYFGISISPSVGYQINPYVEGGLAIGYQYSKNDWQRENLFSVGPFINVYPIESLFTRVQFEQYIGKGKTETLSGTDIKYDYNESALWVGAGYRSPGKISFYAGMMYNVLYQEDDSIFASGFRPILGVSFGF